MPTQYKFIKNFISPIECDNFIGKLPLLDINTAPAIDRENEEVPLDTGDRLELLPTRIELNVSHTILSKISKLLEKQVSAMDNRMYVIRYQEGEFCVPHVDPTEKTIIIQLNNDKSIITHNQLYGKWTSHFLNTIIKHKRVLRIEFCTQKEHGGHVRHTRDIPT